MLIRTIHDSTSQLEWQHTQLAPPGAENTNWKTRMQSPPEAEQWTLDPPEAEQWTLDPPEAEKWTLDPPEAEQWTLDSPEAE